MRGVALSIVLVIASCAPDYGHTAFRCESDPGCPDGQRCVSGRCRRGEPTGDGVGCGSASCAPGAQCCWDLLNLPLCRSAGELCPGTTALCDGALDCQGGDRCCADGGAVFCDAACVRTACVDAGDCPLTAPNCCPGVATPWRECSKLPC